MNVQSCQSACVMNWHCKSISTNENENNLCQLNNQTIESKAGEARAIRKQKWTYWSTDYNDVLVGIDIKADLTFETFLTLEEGG